MLPSCWESTFITTSSRLIFADEVKFLSKTFVSNEPRTTVVQDRILLLKITSPYLFESPTLDVAQMLPMGQFWLSKLIHCHDALVDAWLAPSQVSLTAPGIVRFELKCLIVELFAFFSNLSTSFNYMIRESKNKNINNKAFLLSNFTYVLRTS